MPERDIGQEILNGIREIKEHKAGLKKLKTHKRDRPALSPFAKSATLRRN